ncbi:MAG: flavin reductase family protein [Oscillospiraceae bacterium]|nr:flavin reductase family protein [Oscillospiraceae bacterium]
MMEQINIFDHASHIMNAVKSGVLLTAKADGKVNTMAISWGMIGIEWNKPVFITFVRDSRFTKEFIDKTGVFTVNIPTDATDPEFMRKVIGYCGSRSGRDTDKAADMGFTLVDGITVDSPAIKEIPLTLECKVIYKQKQDPFALDESNKARFYGDGDIHTAYYGEIVNSYII